MISNMYSIQDAKAGLFFRPFPQPNDAVAVREFATSIQSNKESQIARTPGDFNMYCIGTYDDSTGLLTAVTPRLVVGAASLIQ